MCLRLRTQSERRLRSENSLVRSISCRKSSAPYRRSQRMLKIQCFQFLRDFTSRPRPVERPLCPTLSPTAVARPRSFACPECKPSLASRGVAVGVQRLRQNSPIYPPFRQPLAAAAIATRCSSASRRSWCRGICTILPTVACCRRAAASLTDRVSLPRRDRHGTELATCTFRSV